MLAALASLCGSSCLAFFFSLIFFTSFLPLAAKAARILFLYGDSPA
jgi:hypothetical protein